MLNAQEIKIITNGYLHLQSRVIYTAYLSTYSENGEIVLDYVMALNSITIISQNGGYAYRPNAEEINGYILELIRFGLLEPLEKPASVVSGQVPYYSGIRCRLPARFAGTSEGTSFRLYPMHADWQPSSQFAEQAQFSGLSDISFNLTELNEFVSYWITTRAVKDDPHWNLAFINFLKRKRHEI